MRENLKIFNQVIKFYVSSFTGESNDSEDSNDEFNDNLDEENEPILHSKFSIL